MPGVSRKAIGPRDSLRIPTIRLRVVCGLAETMETFCPRMRLRSVDLPALGRPTRATTPNFVSRLPRGGGGAPVHQRLRNSFGPHAVNAREGHDSMFVAVAP